MIQSKEISKIIFYGLFFILSSSFIVQSFAQTAYLSVEQNEYQIKTSGEDMVIVKIFGNVEKYSAKENKNVAIIITLPDGSKDNHEIFSTSNGYFELLYPLTKSSQEGKYKVSASLESGTLNEITFNVKKVLAYEEIKKPIKIISSSVIPSIVNKQFYSEKLGLTVDYPRNWQISELEERKAVVFADTAKAYSNKGVIMKLDYEKFLDSSFSKIEMMKKFESMVTDINSDVAIEGLSKILEKKISENENIINFYLIGQYQILDDQNPTEFYKLTIIHNFLVSDNNEITYFMGGILPEDITIVKPVIDKMISSITMDSIIVEKEKIIPTPIIPEKTENIIKNEPEIIEESILKKELPEPLKDTEIGKIETEKQVNSKSAELKETESNPAGGVFLIIIIVIIIVVILKRKKKKSKMQKNVFATNQDYHKKTNYVLPKQVQELSVVNKEEYKIDTEKRENLKMQKEVKTVKNPDKQGIITPMESRKRKSEIAMKAVATRRINNPDWGANNNSQKKTGACKGVCVNFKAKRPATGGRYDSGQGRCQICEIYIDHKGAHMKDGTPATEDSVGWFCNCCNYRVRQKPRAKAYKEKLNDRIEEKVKKIKKKDNLIAEASKIKAEIDALKKKTKILDAKPVQTRKKAEKRPNTNKINERITDSLILIRSKRKGILQSEIQKLLSLSNKDLEILIPKLIRIEGISEEDVIRDGIVVNKLIKLNKMKEEIKTKETKLSEKSDNKLSKISRIESSDELPEIKSIAYQMVAEQIRWKNNINKNLKLKLIEAYLKHKSMSKMYNEFPNHTKKSLRLHLVTDKRLPPKLKELENSGGLHSNPKCSIAIALYATDYFNWDKENNDEGKIIKFANSISNYLKTDKKLNTLFEGRR